MLPLSWPVEMSACLDYEQALECKAIFDLIGSLRQTEKDWMLAGALKLPSRFAPLRFNTTEASNKFRTWGEMAKFPQIPAVCIAASCFPKHWLEASASERKQVLETVKALYPIERLPISDFPLSDDETELLTASAEVDGNTTLHVLAVNRNETRSALLRRFKAWLDAQPIVGSNSRKGKVNVPARLDDLSCYRLSALDSVTRETVMSAAGFKRSVARLSAAKKRAQKRLSNLGYI